MSAKNKKYILSLVVLIVLFAVYYIISNRPGFEDLGNMNGQSGTAQTADAENQTGTQNGSTSQEPGSSQNDVNDDSQGGSLGTGNAQDQTDQQNSGNAQVPPDTNGEAGQESDDYVRYYFRNDKLLTQHYEKHGIEMGFDSKEDYEKAASDVVNNPAALHKTEKEDGDYVYYVEKTNEFVIVSTDGYLRTYFNPNAGISYYNRQ